MRSADISLLPVMFPLPARGRTSHGRAEGACRDGERWNRLGPEMFRAGSGMAAGEGFDRNRQGFVWVAASGSDPSRSVGAGNWARRRGIPPACQRFLPAKVTEQSALTRPWPDKISGDFTAIARTARLLHRANP